MSLGWVTGFLIISLVFNLFNVRRYGEIEFLLTVVKVLGFVGLILAGIALPLNASTQPRLLGTQGEVPAVVNCQSGVVSCLSDPGFGCTSLADCS
jgi:amino acid permease